MATAERQPRTDEANPNGLPRRIRTARLKQGLSVGAVASAAQAHPATIRSYEHGASKPSPERLFLLANALSVPVASLLTDELVLAELRVSPESLERVRREGLPAAQTLMQSQIPRLVALLMAEATRPPVDVSRARAKRRRTRAEVLAGVEEARLARQRKQAARVAREEIR